MLELEYESRNFMMKNKGFTLVEVIMVVAILGIIIGIAVPSYIAISNNIKTKSYEQKVDNIKAKALEYANDNNVESITIPVKALIEEGYLAEENPDGNDNEKITNPLGGYLDCTNIDIVRTDDSYEIKLSDTSNCSTENIVNNDKISIDVYEYRNNTLGKKLNNNGNVDWTNSDKVLLYANVNNLKGIGNEATWNYGTLSKKKKGNITTLVVGDDTYVNIYIVEALVFFNGEYSFNINTSSGMATQKVNVKIDREKPSASASVASEWTMGNKKATFSGSDGSGSGIKSFYLGDTNVKPNEEMFNRDYDSDYITDSLDVGEYYLYALDNAGNISDSYHFVVSGVDKNGPICKKAEENTTWTNKTLTLIYGCKNDIGTGCKTADMTTIIDYTAKTKYLEWTIEDNIGNITECHQLVDTYVDKTAPTCVSSGGFDDWTNGSRTITGTCSDEHSGCADDTKVVSKYYDEEINSDSESPGVIYDKVGNSTTCPTQTVKIDKTKPTVSLSVSSTSSGYNNTTANVSVSSADSASKVTNSGVASICVQTSSDVNNCFWKSGSSVSQNMGTGRSYDGGSTTFYAWSKDNAGNISSAASSSYTVYKNCSSTWTSWGDWGGCSSSCGSGTKSRGGTKYDNYLSSYCGDASDSTSCSESYGCPPPSSGDSGGGSSGGSSGGGNECWADLNHPDERHGYAVYNICRARGNGATGQCYSGCSGTFRGWADEYCVYYECR